MSWLERQQEADQGFRVAFDQFYAPGDAGPVAGHVDEVSELEGERVPAPWVAFEGSHGDEYAGPVQGRWKNVNQRADYSVAVFSETDALYLQGVYPLRADGTWSSGTDIARRGNKVAHLVRNDSESVVAVSGAPETRIRGLEVEIYVRTDVDYFQERVPLYADGSFMSTRGAGYGEKIARLVRVTQPDPLGDPVYRTLSSSEWADAPGYKGLVRSFFIPQDDPDYGYQGDASQRAGKTA